MRARASGAIYSFWSGETPKAAYQASILRGEVAARTGPGECGSVVSCSFSAASRDFSRQTCAQPRKTR